MKKEQLDILEANRHMEQCIYVPSLGNGRFIVFCEGTGDNLLREDMAEGYVDYINFTEYTLTLDGELELEEYDGGMVLLKEYYADMLMIDILEAILEEASYPDGCPDVEKEDIIVINTEEV